MGLSLAEAWRSSPRTIRLVTEARTEAALDEMEQRVHAAYASAWFRGQKRLGPSVLKKMLPKRRRAHVVASSGAGNQEPALDLADEIKRHDAWANSTNRNMARRAKADAEREATEAERRAAREERKRQRREAREC